MMGKQSKVHESKVKVEEESREKFMKAAESDDGLPLAVESADDGTDDEAQRCLNGKYFACESSTWTTRDNALSESSSGRCTGNRRTMKWRKFSTLELAR